MHISIRRQFEALSVERSPENLTCDGELSKRKVQARHAAIMRDWRALEKLVGRKVTLAEIEDRMYGKADEYPPGYMQGRGAA